MTPYDENWCKTNEGSPRFVPMNYIKIQNKVFTSYQELSLLYKSWKLQVIKILAFFSKIFNLKILLKDQSSRFVQYSPSSTSTSTLANTQQFEFKTTNNSAIGAAIGLAATLTIAIGIIIVLLIYIRKEKQRSKMDIEMARSELIETRRDLQVSEMLYKRTPKVIESLINENQFKKVKCESRPPNLPSVPPPTQLQSFLPHSTHSNIKTVVSKHNIKDFSSHQDNTYLNTYFNCQFFDSSIYKNKIFFLKI